MKKIVKKALFLLLITLTSVNLLVLSRRQTKTEEAEKSLYNGKENYIQEGSIEKMDSEEILNLLQQQTDNSAYSISISSVLYFPNGTLEPGILKIENPENNHYNSIVTVTLDDTGELVYTSPLLKPNQHIESMPLNSKLEKGSYPATASFNVYSGEIEESLVGIIQAGVKIEVE